MVSTRSTCLQHLNATSLLLGFPTANGYLPFTAVIATFLPPFFDRKSHGKPDGKFTATIIAVTTKHTVKKYMYIYHFSKKKSDFISFFVVLSKIKAFKQFR